MEYSVQQNVLRLSNARISSKPTAYLVRRLSRRVTEGSCSVKFRVVRYQAEAQPFRSHQIQALAGILAELQDRQLSIIDIDIIAF